MMTSRNHLPRHDVRTPTTSGPRRPCREAAGCGDTAARSCCAAAGPAGSLGGRVRAHRRILVRGGGGHRDPAAAVLPPVGGRAGVPRLIPVAGRRHHEPGVPIHTGHQFRRPRRAADPAGASLVGGPVRRGDNPAAAAGVLPRPVLRPGTAGLADLGNAAATGHASGLHRHHLARRRTLRRQPGP